ncbi:MAG: T9SS type A sorting domain-containing protein [Bacteroidetes bacterium]|nr:T9SS type A sorting domain-containing protein [Bacteroidota bacterium]
MKKVLTLFAMILMLGVSAQKYQVRPADVHVLSQIASRAVADTLLWNVNGPPQLYLLPNPLNPTQGIGYVAGTDNLASVFPPDQGSITVEDAQIFMSKNKIKVLGAKFTFGSVKYVSNDTNSKVVFKLFKLDGNFINYNAEVVPGPSTVVSAVEMPIRDVKQLISGQETLFSGAQNIIFPTPLTIDPATADSGYVIGFDISQLSPLDTLGLFTSTINGPVIPERSLVRFLGNTLFNSFKDTLDYGGWGANVDLAIFPIVDPNQYRDDVATICSGDSFNFNGNLVAVQGTYVDTFSAAPLSNYDTIVTLQLTVAPALDKTIEAMGDTLNANQTGAIYQWINCTDNSAIAGETFRTFIVPQDGQYKVLITKGGCTTVSACVAVGNVGIHESNSLGFILKPNPARGVCTLYTGDIAMETWSAALYNVQGQMLKVLAENQNSTMVTFNTGEIMRGMYFIRLTDRSGKSGMKKLVVE